MKSFDPVLFVEISNSNFIFFVGIYDENENFNINYKSNIVSKFKDGNKISDPETIFSEIKEIIFLIERKFNYTFKEITIILDYKELSFVNLTGFKNLNGSQVVRENITYILNSLKSYIDETETKKTILHIFNSKFNLDNKKIDNLPIGLFGDFYSHELSLILINKNDYKNLKIIFEKCNLKVKKILTKSFVEGVNTSKNHKNIETFFQVKIKDNSSKIFYFENNALKFQQNFNFGTNIIIKDISKVISLDEDTVKKVLNKNESLEMLKDELIEEELFKEKNYRKIKKKLIHEIALARIQEISEIIIFNNINFSYCNKISDVIFLEIDPKIRFKSLDKIFRAVFSSNGNYKFNFIEGLSSHKMLITADKLVHFGWKKEAIPVSETKKTLIARFFDAIFG